MDAPGFIPASFTPYGGLHLVTVVVCLSAVAALAAAGRWFGAGTPAEWRLRKAIAGSGLAFWVVYNIGWNWNGLDLYSGLPLHICDVSGVLAPFALITQNRWLRATLYFWAMALTTQAFIQPTVTAGPASPIFWSFWISHTLIVTCAVYDLAVLRLRPDWRDLARVYAVSAAYFALVFPLNVWLGSNYAYVGNPGPGHAIPPFVEALGPWPQRALFLAAMAAVGFAILLLPWLGRPKPRDCAEPAESAI